MRLVAVAGGDPVGGDGAQREVDQEAVLGEVSARAQEAQADERRTAQHYDYEFFCLIELNLGDCARDGASSGR